MSSATEFQPFDYPCERADWDDFIVKMRSGTPVAITEEMMMYWLEVLPPVYLKNPVTLPDGHQVRADFGFAEGAEEVVVFWRIGKAHFCCRTNTMNPHAF